MKPINRTSPFCCNLFFKTCCPCISAFSKLIKRVFCCASKSLSQKDLLTEEADDLQVHLIQSGGRIHWDERSQEQIGYTVRFAPQSVKSYPDRQKHIYGRANVVLDTGNKTEQIKSFVTEEIDLFHIDEKKKPLYAEKITNLLLKDPASFLNKSQSQKITTVHQLILDEISSSIEPIIHPREE